MPNYTYGGLPIEDMHFGIPDNNTNIVSKVYNGEGDIIWSRRPSTDPDAIHPRIAPDSMAVGDITWDNKGQQTAIVFYSEWLIKTDTVYDTNKWEVITLPLPSSTPGITREQLFITSLTSNTSDTNFSDTITITFDDSEHLINQGFMPNIDITVTQLDAAKLTAMGGVFFDGHNLATPATATYDGSAEHTITVEGEEGATFTIVEVTDPDNIVVLPAGEFTIPSSGTVDLPVFQLVENNTEQIRTFTFNVVNSVITTEVLGPFTVNQAQDDFPVITITDPGEQKLGTGYNLEFTIVGDHAPFRVELSRDNFATTPAGDNVIDYGTQGNSLTGSFPIIPLAESETFYMRVLDTDGASHDTSPIDSVTVTSTAISASFAGAATDLTPLWNVQTIPVSWTSSVDGLGVWTTSSPNVTFSVAPTYDGGADVWNATVTLGTAVNPDPQNTEGFSLSLDYDNGTYSEDNVVDFIITRGARPQVQNYLAGNLPDAAQVLTITSAMGSVTLTIVHDIGESFTGVIDNSSTDDDFLNLMTVTSATGAVPAGANFETTSSAAGLTTVPREYVAATDLTFTNIPDNTTAGNLMDLITVQTAF